MKLKLKLSLGFTLAELLVTVSVAGILLAVGVPSMTTMIKNNRISVKVNEMVAEFNFARSEAVKRGTPVTVCKRNTAGSGCLGSAAWTSGWVIFSDVDGDGVVDNGTDAIIRVHGSMTNIASIDFSHNNNRITFNASGFAPSFNNTITFCDSRGISKAKGLVLSDTGRLRKWVSGDNPGLVCP